MSSGHQTAPDRTRSDPTTTRPLFADPETALHGTREIVGRKWHPVLLYYLLTDGPLRFSDLKSRVDGISSKMLSEGLSALEEAGLIRRRLLSDQPVRVEYDLTDRGESLEDVILGMVEWGSEYEDRAGMAEGGEGR
jgi:DNA-binding HxlR family transcriptional regulator